MNLILSTFYSLWALFSIWTIYANEEDSIIRKKRLFSTAIKSDESVLDFPIILPPYNYVDLDQKDFGDCLFYLESISVYITQNSELKKANPTSAFALLRGGKTLKNKFKFDKSFVKCYNDKSNDFKFSFRVKIDLNEKAEAKSRDSKTLFSINDEIDFNLNFNIKSSSWNFTDLVLNKPLIIKKENNWLPSDLSILANDKNIKSKMNSFGSFKDYCYACSSTPIVTWIIEKPYPIVVGFKLNNLQVQAYNITLDKKKKTFRFTSNVNDCIGTFSVGSWMSIIVILIFLFILSFAYLMLNSVQTMDRFDDPKQKQLIVNVKE